LKLDDDAMIVQSGQIHDARHRSERVLPAPDFALRWPIPEVFEEGVFEHAGDSVASCVGDEVGRAA
jgi:hypothetical protein